MSGVVIDWYDGHSSRARPAEIGLDPDGVCWLTLDGERRYYALADLRVSDRLGNTMRSIAFPDGSRGETADNDGVDRLLAAHRPAASGWLHRLESRYSAVLAALLLTVLATWAFVAHGVPWLAEQVAEVLPASLDRHLGEQTLAALDEALFEPTALDQAVRDDYRARFAALARGLDAGHDYRLLFRHSPVIGANALALPDGSVLLTDELVGLAKEPAEVEAVLAHELGHVARRHGLRSALQSSLVVLVVAAVTGDLGSAGGLASALPVVLVESGYSRDLETEADLYGRQLMDRHGIPRQAFPAILRRLAAAAGEGGEGHGFLDTHPSVPERAALFEAPTDRPPRG